jgi:hypothetical protein
MCALFIIFLWKTEYTYLGSTFTYIFYRTLNMWSEHRYEIKHSTCPYHMVEHHVNGKNKYRLNQDDVV